MAKIYISSTYSDLWEFRERVYQILRQWSHDVIAMEDYIATDQRPLDKCVADVKSCDLYIGIFAWHYGYVPLVGDNPLQLSITELELQAARASKIECLLFLLHEAAAWPPLKIDNDDARRRIVSLRDDLSRDFTVSFFTDRENLAALVSAAVGQWEKRVSGGRPAQSPKPYPLAAIHVMNLSFELPYWSDSASVKFSITNLTDGILKLTKLILEVTERKDCDRIALKKAGAPYSEFKLRARIEKSDVLDLLSDLEEQFVLDGRTSDAFNLALSGPEGCVLTCRLRACVDRLADGEQQWAESSQFKVMYPIRSLAVLKKKRGQL
jgi:uncharacterized protein DUF4062